MEEIRKVFPQLSTEKASLLLRLAEEYRNWNQHINLISRKDIDRLETHHLLHSLLIARIIDFGPGTEVLDLGTGGGLPGLPLAIYFPETRFHLIDGTGKKIRVVNELIQSLELKNVRATQVRAEELKAKYDFVVSRAVARIDQLLAWSRPLIHQRHRHALPNGLLCLKGGRIDEELATLPRHEYWEKFPLSIWTDLPYFEEKYAVYVQA